MTVQNQKIIEMGSKSVCDKNNTYTTINLTVLQDAMSILNTNAFKLWMFYAKNKSGFKVESGPAAVASWGIDKSSYYRAFNTLIEEGFLERKSETYFVFHEKAMRECIVEIAEKEDEVF